MKQHTSDYTIGDIIGVIIPDKGNVATIVGEVIQVTQDIIVIRKKNNLDCTKDTILITQENLDNEEVVISKYN